VISEEDRDALKKRADALGQKLDGVRGPAETKAKRAVQTAEDNAARSNALGQAFRISVDLIVGVGVGGGVGWLLDGTFGTRPWCLVAGLFVGFAAGMMNVVRTARQMQAKAEPMQRSAPSIADEPDDR
jgi:ATP synthase protein I